MKNELMITSGFSFENYVITEYLGFCSGECVLGTGFLSSLGASLADMLGSTSTLYEGKLESAKRNALDELYSKAKSLGANAIIGIDVDYTTFSSDIMGVIANGTAVKIKPVDNEICISSQISVDNYNPDLSFRASTLLLSSLNGKHSFSLTLSGNFEGTISAINTDIILFSIFDEKFTLSDISFLNFEKAPYLSSITSSPTTCQLPQKILPLIKSSHVILKKYIFNDTLYTVTNNNLLWSEKKKLDITNSISHGLNIDEYMSYITSLSSAGEIMTYTQDINEKYNFISPELMKIISSHSSLERMYGNAKDSCIEKIKEYFFSDSN